MKNCLFLGNGLFRLRTEEEKKIGCEGRDKSWETLLSEIAFDARDSFDCNTPMPIEYDRIVASAERNRDYLEKHYSVEGRNDKWRQVLNDEGLDLGLKRYVADWFNERSFCTPDILDDALSLDFDFFLTSNYDLRIEERCKKKADCLQGDSEQPHEPENVLRPVWHVHGSIDPFDSIVLGQGDYLKSAMNINRLINNWDREAVCSDEQEWPLLFITANIFILGFGFGLEEIDLWHLLHLRSVLFSRHPELPHNHIRYYNLYPSGEKSLRVSDPVKYYFLTDYEIQVIDIPVVNNDYEDGYKAALDLIADTLTEDKSL